MKTEKLYREQYNTRQEVKTAVLDYIEGVYNPHRLNSTLGNMSPAAFKNRHYVLNSVSDKHWQGLVVYVL